MGGEDHLRYSETRETLAGKQFFPVPVLKKLLKHVLLGLAQLHKQGIAHTSMSIQIQQLVVTIHSVLPLPREQI